MKNSPSGSSSTGGKVSAPAARQLIAFGTTLDAAEASLGLSHPIPAHTHALPRLTSPPASFEDERVLIRHAV